MSVTTAHIINHTHWDREWFLTSVYTSRWIPGLIDKLEQLVAANPNYQFWLDGQTLVIEDLLAVAPTYEARARALIGAGNLIIGPYYCQSDWQLTGGELLIRNLLYGRQDMAHYGRVVNTGWLVDTFGHISQTPQIHQLFGIEAVYVWRGVPQLLPYFTWQGADGSRLLTINLFGGYRNLYGVTHTPEVAITRLHAEVEKLQPYYPTPDIPLFDGYDLEDDPEDPLRFYQQQGGVSPTLQLRETTPMAFAREVEERRPSLSLPVIAGELNSGKYGATFPGTFSARTYLKIMAHDCERLLFQVCEPLATLAYLKGRAYQAASYEGWARLLLQNAVHDCLCGVSIDQVHEKMEHSYRQVFDAMRADVEQSLAVILDDFAPGTYAVSTHPFAVNNWQAAGEMLVHAQTEGVGIWPVAERVSLASLEEPVETFTWRNGHYEATVGPSGVVHIGKGRYGLLIISAEQGDTYSEEAGERLGEIRPIAPLTITQQSERHTVLTFRGAWQQDDRQVTVTIRLHFDPSPLLRWQIDLESRGSDLRVEMVFDTGQPGEIAAGMPFDVVRRPAADTDLLPRTLSPELSNVLLGQRELNAVTTFPFHDFVAVANEERTVTVLARGLHSYTADGRTITLLLRRAVEWLTRADLRNRVGDAGPFFYVPDARCERVVRHEVAVAVSRFAPDSMALQQLNATFQNPPLIVQVAGEGANTSWQVLQEKMPLSSLYVQDGHILARLYNPTSHSQPLSHLYRATAVWGEGDPAEEINAVAAKQIATVSLPHAPPHPGHEPVEHSPIQWLTQPHWRVGENAGRPDPAVVAQLEAKIVHLEARLAETAAEMQSAQGAAHLRLQHLYYVIQREQLEYRLSALLNRRKLAQQGTLSYDYLYLPDEEVAAVGLELNRLRIKRRIFDYVIAAL